MGFMDCNYTSTVMGNHYCRARLRSTRCGSRFVLVCSSVCPIVRPSIRPGNLQPYFAFQRPLDLKNLPLFVPLKCKLSPLKQGHCGLFSRSTLYLSSHSHQTFKLHHCMHFTTQSHPKQNNVTVTNF